MNLARFLVGVPALAAALALGHDPAGAAGEAAAPAPAAAAKVTPLPPLPPADEQARFQVAPGFRVELVAAEPLVEAPVAMAFDPEGRLWVVEMRGFMRTADGAGEDEPSGRVVILEDRNGDGRMDQRKIFLEGLVMPRSLAFVNGGVLVAAPPELLFCPGRGDRCNKPQVVATDYGARKNPEHTANGLFPAIDNWLYNANLDLRHRFVKGRLIAEPTLSRGQWGISQDDLGRLVFNANSDYLRGDDLPVYAREAHVRGARGVNVRLDADQSTWPGHPTPGVNRAYQPNTLRRDGSLAKFTAACAPHVYRGQQFPADFAGNVFVAEPSANLVRRSVLSTEGERRTGKNAYAEAEFLTSTDERFRPVGLGTGPDGALYVADFYRGIIQHRIYLTPYLRGQVRERALDTPVDRGRIWRVVSTAGPLGARPHLLRASTATLVKTLAHPNGWWRDTAQRLLIDRGDRSALPATTALARTAPEARTRLHALFVLEGLGAMTPAVLEQAGADADPFVRAAAEGLRARGETTRLLAIGRTLAGKTDVAEADLAPVAGKELDLLALLLTAPLFAKEAPGRAPLLARLGARVTAAARPEATERLLELAAVEPKNVYWRQRALLDGVAQAKTGERAGLTASPEGWGKLRGSKDPEVARRAQALDAWVRGKSGGAAARPQRTLADDERARFDRGRAQYPAICGACHHPSGRGEEGKAPPLRDSPWVLGPPERLVRIALHGLHGPVQVGDRVYEMDMPSMGALEDEQLADLFTYLRLEPDWGHDASPIDPATIARVRKATETREDAWTAEELMKVK